MSLKSPDDEYDELVPEGNNFFGKITKKYKLHFILLLIGILLGAFLQFYYINPFISGSMSNSPNDCTNARILLNKENECLYKLLPDARGASEECASEVFIERQKSIPKDFNEEFAN
jgi:hypothetical protein